MRSTPARSARRRLRPVVVDDLDLLVAQCDQGRGGATPVGGLRLGARGVRGPRAAGPIRSANADWKLSRAVIGESGVYSPVDARATRRVVTTFAATSSL